MRKIFLIALIFFAGTFVTLPAWGFDITDSLLTSLSTNTFVLDPGANSITLNNNVICDIQIIPDVNTASLTITGSGGVRTIDGIISIMSGTGGDVNLILKDVQIQGSGGSRALWFSRDGTLKTEGTVALTGNSMYGLSLGGSATLTIDASASSSTIIQGGIGSAGVYLGTGDSLILNGGSPKFIGGDGSDNGASGLEASYASITVKSGSPEFTGGNGNTTYDGGHGALLNSPVSFSIEGSASPIFTGGNAADGNGGFGIDFLDGVMSIGDASSAVFTGGNGSNNSGPGAFIGSNSELSISTSGTAEFYGGAGNLQTGLAFSSSDFNLSDLKGKCIAAGAEFAWSFDSTPVVYAPSNPYSYWINRTSTARTGGNGGEGAPSPGGVIPFDYATSPGNPLYIEINAAAAFPLPPGTPKNVEPVLPDPMTNKTTAANATGVDPNNLDSSGGGVTPKRYLAILAAGEAFGSGGFDPDKFFALPIFSAQLMKVGDIAAVGFRVSGKDLMAEYASDIRLVKVLSDTEGAPFTFEWVPEKFADMKFTILKMNGDVIFGALKPGDEYWLVLFIEDGGGFDLDHEKNGVVIDPAGLFGSKGGGGGGCDAMTMSAGCFALIAMLAGIAARRAGRQK